MKQLKIKTFKSLAVKKTVTSSQRKTKELVAERNLFGQIIVLAVTYKICLRRLLTYSLGPVPWHLARADGTPVHTDKSTLMKELRSSHIVTEKPIHHSSIVDGNATFHELMNVPATFGEVAERLFNSLPKSTRVDFVTDTYMPHSIKDIERQRRAASVNVDDEDDPDNGLTIEGPSTKVPSNFKEFLSKSSCKTELIDFLHREWSSNKYAGKLVGRQVYFVNKENVFRLSTQDGVKTICDDIPNLKSTHEEADTRIILHAHDISNHSLGAMVVRCSDTDVLILLLKFVRAIARPILMDAGTGDNRKLLDINTISMSLGPTVCAALPAVHAFSGCDSTSAFVRKGKLMPFRLLKKSPEFQASFALLGTSEKVSDDVYQSVEEFTCKMYASKSQTDSINKLRYFTFSTRFTPNGELLSTYLYCLHVPHP